MIRPAASLNLAAVEKNTLEQWMRAGTTERRMGERAPILLLANPGLTTQQIARDLDSRLARVSKGRQRFLRLRLDGLQDRPRPGKPARYNRSTTRRSLAQLDQPLPPGQATWTGGVLVKAASARARSLHPHGFLLVEPSRMLVQHSEPQRLAGCDFYLAATGPPSLRRVGGRA